jgi:ribosomal protein S18 acetylase RimI-like enzyme
VAHPVSDLNRSTVFYRELLGLEPRGGFIGHDGYDGRSFGLPGGGELELTAGPAQPRPGTDDDLLVLYVRNAEEVRRIGEELQGAGVPTVPSANPYWDRWGKTFLDPDGYVVVIAARGPMADETVRIELHTGPREPLRELFELAEDSPTQLDSYLQGGRVLVAVTGSQIVGHLQLLDTDRPDQAEIKNMAVRADLQNRGIGTRLVRTAVDLVAADRGTALVVATAAADTDNLRFYQRQGFRMRSVERDAFTPASGYPPGLRVDGIELADRVWLDRPVGPTPNP